MESFNCCSCCCWRVLAYSPSPPDPKLLEEGKPGKAGVGEKGRRLLEDICWGKLQLGKVTAGESYYSLQHTPQTHKCCRLTRDDHGKTLTGRKKEENRLKMLHSKINSTIALVGQIGRFKLHKMHSRWSKINQNRCDCMGLGLRPRSVSYAEIKPSIY